MSFSPIVRVRKLLDKMKTERDSPRLKRFLSRSASGSTPSDESATDSMDWSSFRSEVYPTENFIHVLPNESLVHIFSFLEVRDLCSVRAVSSEWCELTESNALWKQLCAFDWNVSELLEKDWKLTYMHLHDLFSEGNWEGMSKWVEPAGFDNEQKTTAKLHFQKRKNANFVTKISSPSAIHRVDSGANSRSHNDGIPPFRDSVYRINGSGVTINCASHSYFKIEGERVDTDETGATFRWYKQFEKHTSVYLGKVDYRTGAVSGTIDYHDGTTHWKGIFLYAKSNRKYSKMEMEARVA